MREHRPYQYVDISNRSMLSPSELPSLLVDAMHDAEMEEVTILRTREKKLQVSEKRLFDTANVAYQRMVSDLGITSTPLSVEYLHILSPEDFDDGLREVMSTELDEITPEGAVFGGHIFLPRQKDRIQFFKNLTHEFVHAIGHKKKFSGIALPRHASSIDEIDIQLMTLRTGIQQISQRDGVSHQFGLGFNEACTEIAAKILRTYVANEFSSYTEEDNEYLLQYDAYISQIIVVEALLSAMCADEQSDSSAALMKELQLLVYTGDPKFLRKVSTYLKKNGKENGLKILFSMDATYESALYCAQQLGLVQAETVLLQYGSEDEGTDVLE